MTTSLKSRINRIKPHIPLILCASTGIIATALLVHVVIDNAEMLDLLNDIHGNMTDMSTTLFEHHDRFDEIMTAMDTITSS